MRGFLDEVAQRLYNKYGAEVSSLKLIFPSRRSRVFFTEALGRIADKPLWQPHHQSLDSLISQATLLHPTDSVRLITELYTIYSRYHAESIDKFYFWGEILLSDFDMIDKYMVDADMLFSNVADLKLLESDISYMTPEQLKIISFWSALEDGKELSKEKQKFLKVWESLPKIYHQFRARLEELGMGYSGMIQRSAVERIKSGEFRFDPAERYAVIGFNALSECEKRVLTALRSDCEVNFFWDYDDYYVGSNEQEAGIFIRDNLSLYGSADQTSHNNFKEEKSMEVVAAASNVLQCKYASKIISELSAQGKVDKETAIVLTDENLLLPLLYALPPQAGKINVTMGYPLKQSLAFSLVERLISLQNNIKGEASSSVKFYHVDVVALLSHPYISAISSETSEKIITQINLERLISVERSVITGQDEGELFKPLFEACDSWQALSTYIQRSLEFVALHPYQGEDSFRRLEFLSTLCESIAQLHNSLINCQVEITRVIYLSLLRRVISQLRVPFEGEPLEGLQVMGILETRNLDFKNVIILSMNDDSFPGNRLTSPSYVPYNLRAAYGVPTPEHHEGVYAYYFYRLISRAENVWMVYCSHADDKSTGEASRYIYQLDYESPFTLKYRDVGVDVNLHKQTPIVIKKQGRVAEILATYTDPNNPQPISPSAINRYVACPLRFYFQHIAKIKEDDSLSEDIDNSMFGNILHEAINHLYRTLIGSTNTLASLEALAKDRAKVNAAVEAAIRKVCKIRTGVSTDQFTGDVTLIHDIVVRYIINGAIAYDRAHSEFSVEGCEVEYSYPLPLANGKKMLIKGTLDRVDSLPSGRLRVIDYKTGGKHLEFKSIDALFEGKGSERQGHIIQTLTYSMVLSGLHPTTQIVPSLYYVRFMNNESYSPLLVDKSSKDQGIATYSSVSEEFESRLTATLSELTDCSIPFTATTDKEETCTYCTFKDICH